MFHWFDVHAVSRWDEERGSWYANFVDAKDGEGIAGILFNVAFRAGTLRGFLLSFYVDFVGVQLIVPGGLRRALDFRINGGISVDLFVVDRVSC